MQVHLGFMTKYRRGAFTAQILHDLRSVFTDVCSDLSRNEWNSTARTTLCICW
jgi:REP element-mobilizing transposase RayT